MSADASTPQPLRLVLLEALQDVDHVCGLLAEIIEAPRDMAEALNGTNPDDCALTTLRDFWEAHDIAQRLLDDTPFPPDALADLNALAGRRIKWKLATRSTLRRISDAISGTRPLFAESAAPEFQEVDRQSMLTAWHKIAFGSFGNPPHGWPALVRKLKRLIGALQDISAERYPAPGADPGSGAPADVDLQAHGTGPELAAGPAAKPQDAGDAGQDIDPQAYLAPRRLAEFFGVSYDALRGRLRRWQEVTPAGGWMETTGRKQNEPKILFQVAAVRHIIDELKTAASETASGRPAKKK